MCTVLLQPASNVWPRTIISLTLRDKTCSLVRCLIFLFQLVLKQVCRVCQVMFSDGNDTRGCCFWSLHFTRVQLWPYWDSGHCDRDYRRLRRRFEQWEIQTIQIQALDLRCCARSFIWLSLHVGFCFALWNRCGFGGLRSNFSFDIQIWKEASLPNVKSATF